MIILGNFASAQTVNVKEQSQAFMDLGAKEAGLKKEGDPKSLGIFIAEITKIFMVAFGLVLVVMIFIGGWMMITAGGEEEKVASASKVIQGAIWGLLVALSGYAIASFVVNNALKVSGYGVSVLESNKEV